MSASARDYHPETRLVHAGTARSQFGETSEGLFLTQGFVYDTAEQCESPLHRHRAGLSLFALLQSDGRDVRAPHGRVRGAESARADRERHGGGDRGAGRAGAGGRPRGRRQGACSAPAAGWSRNFLPRFGVASTLVDGLDLDQWKQAVRPNTKVFFLESPTNPTLDVLDIAAIAAIAHAAGATLVVDNVFADADLAEARSRSARIAWCIPRPSTSTGRGAASAASSWRRKKFIQDNVHMLLRQNRPGDVAVQTPGCCSRAWRRCICASPARPRPPRRSRARSPGTRRFHG